MDIIGKAIVSMLEKIQALSYITSVVKNRLFGIEIK